MLRPGGLARRLPGAEAHRVLTMASATASVEPFLVANATRISLIAALLPHLLVPQAHQVRAKVTIRTEVQPSAAELPGQPCAFIEQTIDAYAEFSRSQETALPVPRGMIGQMPWHS